ncbi:hypothetical protein MtrunA17_Chr5g0430611 [Medicago truncatula]|uniref:Transmembrane protein n=1 Tax=Medicago truncatula TaxID=3880 RepID=A0A396HYQ7_MEDTR|nr:hypothetical protein MtrunA17_Chr5g0430611 [Medicago truncatula]
MLYKSLKNKTHNTRVPFSQCFLLLLPLIIITTANPLPQSTDVLPRMFHVFSTLTVIFLLSYFAVVDSTATFFPSPRE